MQALLDEFLPLYSRTASQRSQKKLADSPFDETFFRKFQFSYPFVILLTSPTSFWRRYFQQWRQQQQQQQQQSGSQWAVCSCCCAINGAVMAPRRPSICRRQCSDHVDRRKFVPHHAAITPLDYRAAAQRDSMDGLSRTAHGAEGCCIWRRLRLREYDPHTTMWRAWRSS